MCTLQNLEYNRNDLGDIRSQLKAFEIGSLAARAHRKFTYIFAQSSILDKIGVIYLGTLKNYFRAKRGTIMEARSAHFFGHPPLVSPPSSNQRAPITYFLFCGSA